MNHINKDTEIKSNLHDKATYVPENSSKPNNGNLRNSDEVLFQSNEAPIFTTDVVPRTGLNDFSLMYPSNKVLKLIVSIDSFGSHENSLLYSANNSSTSFE